jgi:hypothetical protein
MTRIELRIGHPFVFPSEQTREEPMVSLAILEDALNQALSGGQAS